MSYLNTTINTLLFEKMLQFKLPDARCFHIPAGEDQGLTPLRPPKGVLLYSATNMIRIFRTAPRASCPCGERWDGREKPTSELHTCMDEGIEETRNFLEWERLTLGWEHQVTG